jgi:eukaryotic-like serine/threonine-protein kinase
MTDKAAQSGPFGRQDPSLPQVFGRYLLVQRLSRGGMGEIFLAKHGLAGFEKLAVIKKVLPHLAADRQFISRFVDEAQVAIKLQHVNIAQVFEVGRVGDEYFLALEYVEGRDLRRTLAVLGHKRTRFPVDLALFIGRELANGLAYAHRRTSSDGSSLNLVHCDISPPNVLVSFEGETKVIDFGIAKSALRGTATDPKMGFGKFGYMAPEQLIRGGVVDHRTDIYAAGVVLYELLTGQRLYEAGPEPDYRTLAKKVARGEHPYPSELDRNLAPYDQLVATALRPKSEDRYQSAAEFRDAIQQALVAVNPTISTDQLGAYMRSLFADEMTAQRELHDRVALAHLADFQEQFHTQTISTISFALAQLPLQPPPLDPAASGRMYTPTGARPTHSAQQAAVRPSPALLDTMAPPTSSMSSDDLASLAGLADGTGTAAREHRARRRWPLLLIPTVIVVGAVVAFAMRGGSGHTAEAKKDATATAPVATGGPAKTQPAKPAITVEPIEQPGTTPGSGSEIQMTPTPARPTQPAATQPITKPHRTKDHRESKQPTPPPPPDKKEVTKDQVTNRWLAARREYESYKSTHTGLEKEWNDLANYVVYNLHGEANLAETLRRIESFQRKMRED